MKNAGQWAIGIFVAILAVFGLVVGVASGLGAITSFTSADGGHVIVVRNGGMFDNTSIRQIIEPNSGNTYTGLWSNTDHQYPTSQRYFKVSSDGKGDSNEAINVPTKDGVTLGIEGTFYFTLNYQDDNVLKEFDNHFGTREFDGKYAWDGDDGWQNFLDVTVGNLVQNDLRQEIGGVTCTDLLPSCAYIQSNTNTTPVASGNANATIASIQDNINKSFAADVKDTLGGDYFTGIKFTLSRVVPPANIQDAINAAQAAFAQNSQATAAQQQAIIKANTAKQQAAIQLQTDQINQQAYTVCPICGQVALKQALPQGLTTYVEGGASSSVAVGGK